MKLSKLGISLLLIIAVVGIAAVGFTATTSRTNSGQKKSSDKPIGLDKEQWPLVEYDAPEPAEVEKRNKRRVKSARYDKEDRVREPGSEPGVLYATVISNDWETKITALPAQVSDSVLIGEVSEAQAFLSNDKTGVYSEFVIQVDEVLKNDSLSPVTAGESITAERLGGRVKFRSNKVLPVSVMGQGVPRVGQKYVLFLKRIDNEKSYQLLTAYELNGGRVSALDGVKPAGGGSPWQFDKYEGWDEEVFLKTVREAINTPE